MNRIGTALLARVRKAVVSPGGVVGATKQILYSSENGVAAFVAMLGNLEAVLPNLQDKHLNVGLADLVGIGIADEADLAELKAIMEALERYASSSPAASELLTAAYRELDEAALAPPKLPALGEEELAHASCPVVPLTEDAEIRWSRVTNLATGDPLWMPARLVYNRLPALSKRETFFYPTSAGCAAHFNESTAKLGGLLEVVERDAIAITWLLQIPGRRIIGVPPAAGLPWGTRLTFHDITTDLGIPVVLGILRDDNSVAHHTTLAVASSFNVHSAIRKVTCDLIAAYSLGQRSRMSEVPADPTEFSQPHHGATWMSHRDRSSAFDFLLNAPVSIKFSDIIREATRQLPKHSHSTGRAQLLFLVDMLDNWGHPVYWADLTLSETAAAGVKVGRAVIPSLQPLSYRIAARYTGHRRLKQAAAAAGHPEMNPLPVPFG